MWSGKTLEGGDLISMRHEFTAALQRQPDGRSFYLHFTGGFRAAKANEGDAWVAEPVLKDGQPCRRGYFTQHELETFSRNLGIKAIAFQKMSWISGRYYSSWSPLIPGQSEHLRGPSDLWGSVASNLARKRLNGFKQDSNVSHEKLVELC
jgi:hypothetical protein